MRFFAHDGKAVHGPAALEDLLNLPGFDGDTLVCPVGSENSTDWRPALAYPPFREALLATAPKIAPPPSLPQPSPALPCPRCAHANPLDAQFCNACAARMDGREEPPAPKRAMANAREPEPVALSSEDQPPAAEFAPEPATVSPASTWRKTLIAPFIGAALASGVLGWWLLRPAKPSAPSVVKLNPAAVTATAPVSAPPAAVAPPVTTAAAESLPPVLPAPPAVPAPRAPAKRARRMPRKPAQMKEKALIENHAAPNAPAEPAASKDLGVLLPGVPRPVASKSVTNPKAGPTSPIAKVDAAEDPTTRQIREQFLFCAQLLSQAAYADHFDTCLCADAKQAAPYRGRRGYYAAALKKAAAAGTLEISAAVSGIALDGPIAKVTADWKSGASEKPRTETENWQLEDGLWCRFP